MKKPREYKGIAGAAYAAGGLAVLFVVLGSAYFGEGIGVSLAIVTFILLFAGFMYWQKSYLSKLNNKLVITAMVENVQHVGQGEVRRVQEERRATYPRILDLNKYLNSKASRNLTIGGLSGSGKSEMVYFIIQHIRNREGKEFKKIIFQYKNTDKYSSLGIPTLFLKNYVPNVFEDTNAFAEAWNVAFGVDIIGITANAINDVVKSIARQSRNWKQFSEEVNRRMNEKTDNVTLSALSIIKGQMERVYSENIINYSLPESIVVDASGLDVKGFLFYSEYLLRQLFREAVSGKRDNTMFYIDEVHLYTRSGNTIISDIARLVRSRGALLVATQSLDNIQGAVFDNSATAFTSRQTGSKSLQMIKSISDLYHFAVNSLKKHEFVDLVQEEHQQFIAIFKLINPKPTFYSVTEWKPVQEQEQKAQKSYESKVDYPSKIIEALRRPKNIQEIAKWLAKNIRDSEDSKDVNYFKLAIKNRLDRMYSSGVILAMPNLDSVKFKMINGILKVYKTTETPYCRKGQYPSDLHEYVVNLTADVLYHKHVQFKIMPSGIGTADIETDKYVFEIETGLKHDISDLLRRDGQDKRKQIIIIPNSEARSRYKNGITLHELWEMKL